MIETIAVLVGWFALGTVVALGVASVLAPPRRPPTMTVRVDEWEAERERLLGELRFDNTVHRIREEATDE